MRTSPPDGAVFRFGVALARRLWIALALTLVVAAGAMILYARPSASWWHAYIATQAVRIAVTTGSATSTYDAYLAHQEAEGLARDVASGALFSSAAFDEAVVAELATQHTALVARFGTGAPSGVAMSDVAGALTATNNGDIVTISCRWSSAAGANALLSAATSILTNTDDLRALAPAGEVAQCPNVALAQPTGSFIAAHSDPSVADAARQELLARITLGALFGLAIAVLLAGLSFRFPAARMEITAAPDATSASKP